MSIATQERLFPLAIDESKLGSNQRGVLARIDRYGSIRLREAGRIVYINRGRNPNRIGSEWIESAGWRVLLSLSRRGLVRRRRGGLWVRKQRSAEA